MIVKLFRRLRMCFQRWYHQSDSPDSDVDVPEEELDFARQRGSEGNVASAPPEDERITLRCLWAVEFYSPSYIDGLLENLRKLGWLGERDMFESEDPASWLSRSRRDGRGGWKTLGYLVNQGTATDLPGEKRTAPLPTGVDYAHVTMGVLTPSLVAIVVCFTFNDERSAVLEDALRTDRQTITKKTRRGWEHCLPESQKISHIRQIRQDLVRLAAMWFSENLPGIFSSETWDSDVPTCEFLTFRKADPIPSQHEGDPMLYIMMLGVYWGIDAWMLANHTEVKFNLPHGVFFGPPNHCVLTAKESEIGNGTPHHYGDERTVPTILCAEGVLPLLAGYHYHMRRVRDSVASVSRSPKDVTAVLDAMMASDSIDMMAVISELASTPKKGLGLFGTMTKLEPKRPEIAGVESLNQLIHNTIRNGATRLQEVDRATRDRLTQFGSLVGTRENVRLQRKITTLTWVLLAIGVISVALAFFSVFDADVLSKIRGLLAS